MDTFHGAIADTGYYMHEGVPSDAPFLTPIALLTGGQAFKDALKVASGVASTTPQYEKRVDVAKISVYFVVLLRWCAAMPMSLEHGSHLMAAHACRDEVQGFAKNESIAWPWESDKQAAWNEFERMWNLIGITSTKEGGCNITCYKD